MLENITKVEITGAIFDSLTIFDFFNPLEGNKEKIVKGTLLYGRNGTGKSTIAKGFRSLRDEDVATIDSIKIYDKDNQILTLSDEEKAHIFVFDEDYIDNNVRLKQEHLDTIVMLGEAADLTKKIDEALLVCECAKKEYDQQRIVLEEYSNEKSVKAPGYYIERMIDVLRGDDNWAGCDRKINGNRQNTTVREDTYKRFVDISPTKSRIDLVTEFMTKLEELEVAKSGASTIQRSVPKLSNVYQSYNDKEVLNLLATVIEKPQLNEREQKLLMLLEKGYSEELSHRLEYFKSENIKECPYCFQSIDDAYKVSLVKSIEKVLSKIVEEHQQKLKTVILAPLDIDLSIYSKLEGYYECIERIGKLNDVISDYNKNIQVKIDNPYNPIIIYNGMIQELSSELAKALSVLEENRINYNTTVKMTTPIVEELRRINGEMAHYDVIELAKRYETQLKEYESQREIYNHLKNNYMSKKKEVEDLEAQRSNVRIAIDKINACFKYIFFAEDRLKIEYVDGVYKLLSYGKKVKPCDVSVGERNIIALSYFFTHILEGKEEKDAYKNTYLLVIDDPVSSYDLENRIGILSFLKYELGVFLEGNVNTKALVLTHDLKTFYDIHKVFEEIVDVCKKKGYSNAPKFHRFELRDKELKQFSYKNRQEYSELVGILYKYAKGQYNDYEFVIGNMMRQVLEAFSTFEYRKGIDEVSTDENILNLLLDTKYVSYYKNLMYRLVLHGGSHREEEVKTMGDFNFFSLITDAEKRRTAKDVLCFIYLLNKRHLLEHLKDIGDIETELDGWCQEIKERAALL